MGPYSDKELLLIKTLGFDDLAQIVAPIGLYEIMVREVFEQHRSGPEVEALRRASIALRDCNPDRNTPEFDELITF
jgi:hypothetical protein